MHRIAFAVLLISFWPTYSRGADKLDFNRDVRPILFSKCVTCHGPDEEERAADLRLDTATGAHNDLGGYAAVVPGKPDESELVVRVTNDDDDLLMPPPDHGPRLTAAEVATLKAWIAQGAAYDTHWSYKIPTRPGLPIVEQRDWPAGAIDYFTLAKMESAGLQPSPRADRFTLARRLALDLTGLPPTWQQVKEFAHDTSDDAYEKYVDALLANPAFGERWARVWLDLARYADSAGYADDPPRTIWAYRDYVIKAINENRSFDQFTIEQIAGDLLENPSEQQLVATAFHRNTLTNNEGGTNDEEFRNVAIVDRVNTTMAVWMGTTMGCAQCHSHKYDPITQEEYFQLFAFFNNTADADRRDESPTIELWTEKSKQRKQHLADDIARLEKAFNKETAEFLDEFAAWLPTLQSPPTWSRRVPQDIDSKREFEIDDLGWIRSASEKTDKADYTIRIPIQNGGLTGLQLEVSPEQKSNFVVSQVVAEWIKEGTDKPRPLRFEFASADFEQDGFPASSTIAAKVNANKGWAISPQVGKTHRLNLAFKNPSPSENGILKLTIKQQSKYGKHLLDSFRVLTTTDATVRTWAMLSAKILSLADKPSSQWSETELTSAKAFFRTIASSLAPVRSDLSRARAELAKLRPLTTVPVMRDLAADKRRTTKIQIRGNFQSTSDVVSEGVPKAFHKLAVDSTKPGAPPTRLELARWLVSRDNPLTSRVIVNRHWEQLFGIGIVETSEEFGSQGELPSHPKLLDWLAVELMESGWDIKHLLKQIVMSETYRQSSMTTPLKVAADPANRMLARGPRFRISAEMVRDQALFVSGLLSKKLFGPPAKPPQPNLGLKAAFGSATDWNTSAGEDRYRRGLYTTWRRSSPYPSMAQFDAPNREVCTVRRIRTNTPLQALVTLNDPVYVEAAQALARRCIQAAASPQKRIEYAFSRVLARLPTIEEVDRLVQLIEQTYDQYKDQPDHAQKMATDPLGPLPPGADPAEYAAWTVFGNVMLNLDELLMKR